MVSRGRVSFHAGDSEGLFDRQWENYDEVSIRSARVARRFDADRWSDMDLPQPLKSVAEDSPEVEDITSRAKHRRTLSH